MHDNLSLALAHLNLSAQQKRLRASVPRTHLICSVLEMLQKLGFVSSFQFTPHKGHTIEVSLKYDIAGQPAIRSISRVSKPGARVYVSSASLKVFTKTNNLKNVYQTIVLSTPCGIMLHTRAIRMNVGGEVLFVIN